MTANRLKQLQTTLYVAFTIGAVWPLSLGCGHEVCLAGVDEVNRRLLDIEHLLDMRLEKPEFET